MDNPGTVHGSALRPTSYPTDQLFDRSPICTWGAASPPDDLIYPYFRMFFYFVFMFFPQALLAGFSFRTGEYKAFAVRKIAAKPEKSSNFA